MKLTENLASVNIGGEYVPLSKGTTTVGKLKFDLALENKTDGLYSWVVCLENDSEERSPRIREFLGLDMVIPVKGAVRLNTLRGDACVCATLSSVVCATSTSLQTEQCLPSVLPVVLQVGATAASTTSTCWHTVVPP